MASKTISVMEEIYKELIRHKKSGESFSDELRRLIHRKGKISECAGLWSWMKASDISSIEKAMERRRRASASAKMEKRRWLQ